MAHTNIPPVPHLSGDRNAVVTPPLVFIMHGDVDLFKSPASLIAYCELGYLEEYDYLIFDASGKSLFAKREGNTYSLQVESALPFDLVELRLELIRFLSRRDMGKIDESLFHLSIDQLLETTNLKWI